KQVAELLNIKENEFVYTSGATMANNLALIGAAVTYRRYGNRICVSTMEHPSIYGICKYLERK
ncbi:MAG: aminotransferase class V-fold PLP-dependent enzyme, partial [Bacteroidaceae bacterium]|nr:aminotransferase class V-fold PLP-dependent enzyme [Bacteroidaceae bacterium]